ncbi:MAG TPA: hypothetical protein VD836_12090 [Solirubrobacteraceae bacterium]|nr:hypothetical protein [Solirubrobacteraceae bacterium]
MGFLDKAKKMAEQAQAKLDEAQQQFNSSPGGQPGGGPVVEYDKHGRPIPQHPPEVATPPQGDPLAGSAPPPPAQPPAPATPGVPPTGQGDPLGAAAAAPAPVPPVAQPGVPPTGTAPAAPPPAPPMPPPSPDAGPVAPAADDAAPAADAAAPGTAGVPEDRNRPSYEPPKLSSGDPLAG